MKTHRFWIGIVCSIAPAALAGAALIWLSSGTINLLSGAGWTALVVKERVELLNKPRPPSLVIVAGSAGLFGIDGRIIAERTGIPVINASSHAALPWSFLDSQILSYLKPGDVALLPLEIEYFQLKPTHITTHSVESAHSLGLDYLSSLAFQHKRVYLEQLMPSFITSQLFLAVEIKQVRPTAGYWSFASLASGDLDLVGTQVNSRKVLEQAAAKFFPTFFNPQARAAICASIKGLRARGVDVIGTPPAQYLAQKNLDAYRSVLVEQQRFYTGCGAQFVLDPSGGHRPLKDMYDTVYHLNAAGRQERSIGLADALARSHALGRLLTSIKTTMTMPSD